MNNVIDGLNVAEIRFLSLTIQYKPPKLKNIEEKTP